MGVLSNQRPPRYEMPESTVSTQENLERGGGYYMQILLKSKARRDDEEGPGYSSW